MKLAIAYVMLGGIAGASIPAFASFAEDKTIVIEERTPLIATAHLTSSGDVVVTLGDGDAICGPFKMDAGHDTPVIELKAGSCIGGTYPNWALLKIDPATGVAK